MLAALEIISTVSGLIQGGLILAKKKENWIFHIIMDISLILFSAMVSLWGDVVENLIYLGFGIVGYIVWYGKTKRMVNNTISYCSGNERLTYLSAISVITVVMYFVLAKTNDPFPILDAVTTAMGLVATYLMSVKKVDSWIIWFIDDILMVCIYFMLPERALYLGILNAIWTFMAVGTFITWHREASGKCDSGASCAK